MHPFFRRNAKPAGGSITHVTRNPDTGPTTLELFSLSPDSHVAIDQNDHDVFHMFEDGLISNLALWGKYPREFVPGTNYVGRYICINARTGTAKETIFDEYVKQRHHNFMYQVRTKTFQFPLSPQEAQHPDYQTYKAPQLYLDMKLAEGEHHELELDITSPPSKLIPDRVHRFDKQRTVNNTYTYLEKHIKHAIVFLQKYKSYGVPMFPIPYCSRIKEVDIARRTQRLVFAPKLHRELKGVTFLNDHTANATLVVCNWPLGFPASPLPVLPEQQEAA